MVGWKPDDVARCAAFTVLRETPLVLVLCDVVTQSRFSVKPGMLRQEEKLAMEILDAAGLEFGGIPDNGVTPESVSKVLSLYGGVVQAWVPPDLEAVAKSIYPDVTAYATTRPRRKAQLVGVHSRNWIPKKLRALSCYESQMSLDPSMKRWPDFLKSQEEYYLI